MFRKVLKVIRCRRSFRKVLKVIQEDQTEHPLMGGAWEQWEGSGAIHKGGDIQVKVCGFSVCAWYFQADARTGDVGIPIIRM